MQNANDINKIWIDTMSKCDNNGIREERGMIICSYCYIREQIQNGQMKYKDMAHSKLFTSGDFFTAICKEYKCSEDNCKNYNQPGPSFKHLIDHEAWYKTCTNYWHDVRTRDCGLYKITTLIIMLRERASNGRGYSPNKPFTAITQR